MNFQSVGSRCKFSLRLILVSVTLLAISIPASQWIYTMVTSRPIELAIEEFENRRYVEYEKLAPLTSREITDYLESNDAMIQQSPARVKSVFRQIANTKRLPNMAQFDLVTYRSGQKPGIDSLKIRMVIADGPCTYYVDIRSVDATPEMQPRMAWRFAG